MGNESLFHFRKRITAGHPRLLFKFPIMRKYQQLLLLLISVFSVIILILYKNENNRLKIVLHAVNFFGRNDEAILHRLENSTKEDDIPMLGPLPIWQALSDSFHAYAAYWNSNELMAGGEVVALVVGKKGEVVNFGCMILYDGGLRSIRGKLQFQHVDPTNAMEYESEFTIYNFFCRIKKDFGQPEAIVLNDLTNSKHIAPEIRIRNVKPLERINVQQNTLNVCVNLVTNPSNRTSPFVTDKKELLQFFLHHQGLGVVDFLIYNGDRLPQTVVKALRHFNIRLHMFPFNFPYSIINATERVRRIIETDCLIRNTNIVAFNLFLEPNEFFYPNAKLESSRSVLRSIYQYSGEINRFELPTFAVCEDKKQKLLIDSSLYDPESKGKHTLYIYRTHFPLTTAPNRRTETAIKTSVSLSLSMALAHRYSDCSNVGKDGLHDWRNSLRADFMFHLQELRSELDAII